MAANSDEEPPDRTKKSYADQLKTNVKWDQRLQRNVLEIILEKSDNEASLSDEHLARLLKNLGIDISSQVEGFQVKGRYITVWMVHGLNIERFCRDESLRVCQGINTSIIRPANRKDVTVSVCGLDFNTPDTFVIDYLNKFGRVITNNVSYVKSKEEGPFKGKYTGERRFQVDFSGSSRSMGTYHVIDGSRVRIFYRGNQKTCARCHKISSKCPGSGVARDCEINNGEKIHIIEHMRILWNEIDFKPTSFTLNTQDLEDVQFDVPITVTAASPPQPLPNLEASNSKYNSLIIRNFHLSVSNESITEFLVTKGLSADVPPSKMNFKRTEKNTCVTIEGLEHEIITSIMKNVHFPICKEKHLGLPLYCRPVTGAVTPEKSKKNNDLNEEVRKPETTLTRKGNAQQSPSGVFGYLKDYLFSPPKNEEKNLSESEEFVDTEENISDDKEVKAAGTPSQLSFEQKLKLHQKTDNSKKRNLSSPNGSSQAKPKKNKGASITLISQ